MTVEGAARNASAPLPAPPTLFHHARRTLRSVADLQTGDHLCCLYDTDHDHRAILLPYLRQGLERGERVLYFVDDHPADFVLGYLREDGIDVEPYLTRGQLSVRTRNDTYVRSGSFDPAKMIALLQAEMDQALAEGYSALRITGEMTWAQRGIPGSDLLIRYESLLNELVPGRPCVVLCQYDRRRFEPALLLDVLRTHPYAILGSEVCENPYYIPPDDFLNHDPAARDLSQWTRDLVDRSRRDSVLEARVRLSELSAEHSLDQLLQVALDEAERLTGSSIGFFHFVSADQRTLGLQAWSTHTLETQCTAEGRGRHYDLEQAGIWADCLRERRPILHNDYGSISHRQGLPPGHAPVVRELVVPVIRGDLVMALLGVGNKARDYGEADIETLVALASLLWDIVRQKQTEEALRESEANLQALLDATTQSTLLLDREGTVLAINEIAAQRMGWSTEQALGQCAFNLIPAALVESRRAHIDGVFATARPTRFEDQREGRWLDHSVMPIMDGHGNVIRAAIFAEDVTERRQAEEGLRLSEDRYRRLVETATEGIWSMDEEFRTTFVNHQMARMLGYTPEEMLGRQVTDFMPPEDLGDHAQRMADRTEGKSTLYERRFVCKDGRVVTHLVSAAPMTDVEGRFAGSVALFTDITDRKRSEEALRESEARLRAVFETAGIALAVAAPSGQTLLWNRGTEELLGYSGAELQLVNSLEITHPDDLEKSKEAVAAVLDGRRASYRLEKRYVHKDGHPIWVDLSVTPIRGPQDEIVAVIGAATDITERKRAEEERQKLEQQIRQTQKMESLGILAGGIAHDFNNILMAILGNAEMALAALSPTSAARTSLSRITVAARRAADLCRQMLTYSGRAPSVQEPVEVCELIEEMAHLLRASIPKTIVVDLHLPPHLPPIQADPAQIRQVVMNLIINASEAIGDHGGVITISVGSTRCDEECLRRATFHDDLAPGPYVLLEVADNGCGMDAATLARIFEPFYTTKFTGRGLGLAAVLGIVRSHRGGLQVDSEPGQGTTFKILFPALPVSRTSAPVRETSPSVGWQGRGTVLLADDEESLLLLGVDMLESLGFTVLTASNGREAVNLYQQRDGQIDLVILDLTMPYMDGATAFRELRRLDPAVRVVLASGYVEEDVTDRCSGQGLVGILQKPYTIGRLRALLADVIPLEK